MVMERKAIDWKRYLQTTYSTEVSNLEYSNRSQNSTLNTHTHKTQFESGPKT